MPALGLNPECEGPHARTSPQDIAWRADVEGCEYNLVEHLMPLLCEQPSSGGRVELLAVEWHPPASNISAAVEHPAVRLSKQLEGPSCKVSALAWV